MSMYQQHPLSAAWPAMSEAEFHSLKESIENIGVQMPIVIFEDQVIDGWNRFRAANELGMTCPIVPFDESIDPVDFVKAMNDARRHITASQRAIAIVSIYGWKPVGRPKNNPVPGTELTVKEMAAEAGVSASTIEHAQTAQKAGLTEKVKSGEMSAKKAASVAKGKPATPTPKPAPAPSPAPVNHELEEAAQAINELAAENEELRDRVAVAAMQGTDEEKAEAAQTIAELRSHITTLEAELEATRTSRDGFQSQNSELMKQVRMLERKLKKVGG